MTVAMMPNLIWDLTLLRLVNLKKGGIFTTLDSVC